jgi:hypothetical protein
MVSLPIICPKGEDREARHVENGAGFVVFKTVANGFELTKILCGERKDQTIWAWAYSSCNWRKAL